MEGGWRFALFIQSTFQIKIVHPHSIDHCFPATSAGVSSRRAVASVSIAMTTMIWTQEIISLVFGSLRARSDYLSVMLLCKKWYRLGCSVPLQCRFLIACAGGSPRKAFETMLNRTPLQLKIAPPTNRLLDFHQIDWFCSEFMRKGVPPAVFPCILDSKAIGSMFRAVVINFFAWLKQYDYSMAYDLRGVDILDVRDNATPPWIRVAAPILMDRCRHHSGWMESPKLVLLWDRVVSLARPALLCALADVCPPPGGLRTYISAGLTKWSDAVLCAVLDFVDTLPLPDIQQAYSAILSKQLCEEGTRLRFRPSDLLHRAADRGIRLSGVSFSKIHHKAHRMTLEEARCLDQLGLADIPARMLDEEEVLVPRREWENMHDRLTSLEDFVEMLMLLKRSVAG